MALKDLDLTLEEQAYWWVERLRRRDIEQHATFMAWLTLSPLHVREFLRADAFEEEVLQPAMRVWRANRASRNRMPPDR